MKPWQQAQWCIPKVDWEFVARMEDILDLYAEAYDPLYPVVCFDEHPYQLVSQVVQPIPAKPGKRQRYDYHYRREGTCNLFIAFCPRQAWRHITVTDQRTKADFAHQMRALVDIYFPHALQIRLVLDNLNTMSPQLCMKPLKRLNPPYSAPIRLPLHPGSCQLAQPGGIGVGGCVQTVSRPTYRQPDAIAA